MSIFTGQEVWHIESPAQVATPSYSKSAQQDSARQRRRPPRRPAPRPGAPARASTTMRWRGERVRPREGQRGSQNPHSMHLSARGEIAGSTFRSLRWASRVVVQDHARVQDAVGIEERLHPLHERVGLVAPFLAHEGRHVAARAVLGLERAVVAVHHEVGERVHEARVAVHRLRGCGSPRRGRSAGSRPWRGRAGSCRARRTRRTGPGSR